MLSSDPQPALWTTWRDRRDGTLVTIVEVRGWNRRIALMPPGGHGTLRVEVGPPAPRDAAAFGSVRALHQHEFVEHFEIVYDPYTGFDSAFDPECEPPDAGEVEAARLYREGRWH